MCVCAHIVFSFYLAAVLITTTEAYCSCSLVVIGAIAERSASLTLHTAQSANDIKWTVRVPYEMELHIGRHKWSRHLRPAQRAVEPSRFPAHICNVHKTSCILPFNHYAPHLLTPYKHSLAHNRALPCSTLHTHPSVPGLPVHLPTRRIYICPATS